MEGIHGTAWAIEASVLPFLLVLLAALSSRYATEAEVNRRFLALVRSAFAAVVLELILLWMPWSHWLCSISCCADILCVYELARYVLVFLRGDEGRWRSVNRALLWLSWGFTLLNLFLIFAFDLDFCSKIHSGFAFFFLCESIAFQVVHQRSDGQFLVMTLLTFLVLDAFVAQHLFVSGFLFAYAAATVLLFVAFFYLEAPGYRAMVHAEGEMEAARLAAEKSIEAFNAANHAKTDFLANTSHEVRTPMNAILGMNEMILREAQDEEVQSAARDIERAGRLLLTTINNILDISKLEAGKMDLYDADYHFGELLLSLEEELRAEMRARGLKFILDVDKSLPDHLHGDAGHLRQVLVNLLDNAAKYTEKGSVTLKVRGEREPVGVHLHITVEDTGIGIREEDLKKLFQSFERVNREETGSILGIGLGLTLVRRLMALMGGSVRAESVYGQGSRFILELPQELAHGGFQGTLQEYEAQRPAPKAAVARTWPDARILVVDDTPVNLVVAKGMLQETKAQVDTAEDGEEALKRLGETRYDLVFLDHRMPGLDGVETLRRAKALDGPSKDAAYVALTANVSSADEYRALGFDGYLPKPFNSRVMLALVARLLPSKG